MTNAEKIKLVSESITVEEETFIDLKVIQGILIDAGLTSEADIEALKKLAMMSYIKEKLASIDRLTK